LIFERPVDGLVAWRGNSGASCRAIRYHVVNRGNRREAIFRSDTDRQRFLGRLAELPERFRTEIHAFVLMDNHYHLLLRTQRRLDSPWDRVAGGLGECRSSTGKGYASWKVGSVRSSDDSGPGALGRPGWQVVEDTGHIQILNVVTCPQC
jgi:hypothetical protein